MFSFFFKKGFVFLISIWSVVTLTFFLIHWIPGDPFIGEREIPEELLRSLYEHYGLGQPLRVQYWAYLKNILFCNFGISLVYPNRSVFSLIREGLSVSALLGFEALVLAVAGGVILGIWGVKKEIARVLSFLGFSLPIFALASILQWIFCIQFQLLPVARWGTFAHTILPAISLAAMPAASIARLVRSSLIEIFEQDYIQAAKAKGLSERKILFRHALKKAIFPVVAYLGPTSIHLLTGSFIVEKIFSIPGLGKTMIASLIARDYPVVLGLTIFMSVFLMTSTLIVDLILNYLDPRAHVHKFS